MIGMPNAAAPYALPPHRPDGRIPASRPAPASRAAAWACRGSAGDVDRPSRRRGRRGGGTRRIERVAVAAHRGLGLGAADQVVPDVVGELVPRRLHEFVQGLEVPARLREMGGAAMRRLSWRPSFPLVPPPSRARMTRRVNIGRRWPSWARRPRDYGQRPRTKSAPTGVRVHQQLRAAAAGDAGCTCAGEVRPSALANWAVHFRVSTAR